MIEKLKQAGFAPIALALVALALIAGVAVTVFVVINQNNNQNPNAQAKSAGSQFARNLPVTPPVKSPQNNPEPTIAPIKNKSDLNGVKTDLDASSTDELDAGLKANDLDAASF